MNLGLSSCFILLGSGLLYANTGATRFDDLYVLYNLTDAMIAQAQESTINLPEYLIKDTWVKSHEINPAKWYRMSHMWEKLSNSWKLLKLLIPNNRQTPISEWTNNLCMVITKKFSLQDVDYLRSKSDFKFKSVKEKRVNGNWYKFLIFKMYSNKFLNKLFVQNLTITNNKIIVFNKSLTNSRGISSISLNQESLHPYFITGFSDGESYFYISVYKFKSMRTGWRTKLIFGISLHKKDLPLLKSIQNSLGGIGTIIKHKKDSIQFQVTSNNDLQVLINHFDNFPLITQNLADFILFKQAFEVVKSKQHLTLEGIKKLVAIKNSMNKGLSDELKAAFPDLKLVKRPLVENQAIKDPNWLSGFISAEGCFFIDIHPSKNQISMQVKLKFIITQHVRDKVLLESFINYLNCGKYYNNNGAGAFVVTKGLEIEQIIVFIKKYPIHGIKMLDFADFYEVRQLMKTNDHLTIEGLKRIQAIKRGMNRNRIS
uniref:Homing endonuclease LAGLIDADG domain-containing protein n=1 Tax=Dactylella sp. TaxID=1814903 RepID=A0A482DT39_9PEZI|nr:hypothetical protein [Dactylella sp.]